MSTDEKPRISDFSDQEIKDEFEARFPEMLEPDINDFSSLELIEELEDRGALPEPDDPGEIDEIADNVAEAARSSRHAARAYALLFDAFPDIGSLVGRQSVINGRMKDAA